MRPLIKLNFMEEAYSSKLLVAKIRCMSRNLKRVTCKPLQVRFTSSAYVQKYMVNYGIESVFGMIRKGLKF
jgi:hypothetical protein